MKKLFFVLVGLALILLGYYAQALSLDSVMQDNINTDASGASFSLEVEADLTYFELQPGSSYDLTVYYLVDFKEPLIVYTSINDFEAVKLDLGVGQAHYFDALNGVKRFPARIIVAKNAEQGIYDLKITASARIGFKEIVGSESFKVKVGEKGRSVYLTNDFGKNIAPIIEVSSVSEDYFLMGRNDSKQVMVSFENYGAESDFNAFAVNACNGLEVKALNTPLLRSAGGKIFFKIDSFSDTPEQSCPINLYLKDLGDGRQYSLAEIKVTIKPFYDLALSLPSNKMQVKANEVKEGFLLVENLSLFEQSFMVSSSSDLIQFKENVFNLGPKEAKELRFTVSAPETGEFNARMTLSNNQLARHVNLQVEVLESNILASGSEESGAAVDTNSIIAGMLTTAGEASANILLGVLIVLLIFAAWKGKEFKKLVEEKLGFLKSDVSLKPETTEEEKEELEALSQAEKELKKPLDETKQKKLEVN